MQSAPQDHQLMSKHRVLLSLSQIQSGRHLRSNRAMLLRYERSFLVWSVLVLLFRSRALTLGLTRTFNR